MSTMKQGIVVIACLMLSLFVTVNNAVAWFWYPITSNTGRNLNGVWGSSGSDVFIVGDGGFIVHYNDNGTGFDNMTSTVTVDLNSVWGSSRTNVFAVGAGGKIIHYDGTDWDNMTSVTTETLNHVYGFDNETFAVGNNGTIVHSSDNGSSWYPMTSGTTQSLNGIWGSSGTEVFAVGNSGTILHYDGSEWSSMTSGITQALGGVWGSSGTDVYAVGALAKVRHYNDNGSSWLSAGAPSGSYWHADIGGTSASDISVIGGGADAVNDGSTALYFNGSNWVSKYCGGSEEVLKAIWCLSDSQAFVVGENGTVLKHIDGLTYYVNFSAGNDNNSGLDEDHPWKYSPDSYRLEAGVEYRLWRGGAYSNPLQAGDTIKFKRGEKWDNIFIYTHAAGEPNHPITYTAYGEGADPIITGVSLTNQGWEKVSPDNGTVYFHSLTPQARVYCAYFNDTKLQVITPTSASLSESQWSYDPTNTRVYINIGKNPNTNDNATRVELGYQGSASLLVSDQTPHLTFENLHIEKVEAGCCVYSDYVTIKNCTFEKTQMSCIWAGYNEHLTIDQCKLYDIGASGDTKDGSHRWNKCQGIYLSRVSYAAVTNNYIDTVTASGISLADGTIPDNDTTTIGAHHNIFYNNVITNVSSGVTLWSNSQDNKFYNNTITGIAPREWAGVGFSIHGDLTENNVFRNNIISGAPVQYILYETSSAPWQDFDYNIYYSSRVSPDPPCAFSRYGSNFIRSYNLLDWRAAEGNENNDAHSIIADPLFDNATASHFWSSDSSSPMVNAGIEDNNTEAFGNGLSYASTWPHGVTFTTTNGQRDIGAYEYISENCVDDTDNDGDGLADCSDSDCSANLHCVDADNDTYHADVDCNDNNASVNPGAAEVCNGIDDDCDGQTDEDVTTTYYRDADGDGYGNPDNSTQACSAPSGYVANNTDCNDNDNTKYQLLSGYEDVDNDGYGSGSQQSVCSGASLPSGYSTNNTDNCPTTPNGPLAGTCYNYYTKASWGACTEQEYSQCGNPPVWYKWCDTFQNDIDADGTGDVCDSN